MLQNYKHKLITQKQKNYELFIADKNTNDQVWACVSQVNSGVKYGHTHTVTWECKS